MQIGPKHHSLVRASITPVTLLDPKEEITDPALLEHGVEAHVKLKETPGATEVLDPRYCIRRPGYAFYKIGKVFKVLWPELAGDVNDGVTIVSDPRFSNEHFATKIRWFVVVHEGHDCCSCLPINTYNNRGVEKPGVLKNQHAVIYTGDTEPTIAPGDWPQQNEQGMRKSIKVVARTRGTKLDAMSRVNFGKIYTIEHKVKVLDFGDVDPDFRYWLRYQWQDVMRMTTLISPRQPGKHQYEQDMFPDTAEHGDATADYRPSAEQFADELDDTGDTTEGSRYEIDNRTRKSKGKKKKKKYKH
ncbi:hypothetical protein B0A49_11857 [Cryomyces minteri]|uniref:DUF6590 domain-containing protein n=1 Tax=Cryomyces minteri TaxID=331657 RepID=A0A4U0VQW7_9PEZI|nr:hypothetical protein B0A49_11857 [Cryomyces minteri]